MPRYRRPRDFPLAAFLLPALAAAVLAAIAILVVLLLLTPPAHGAASGDIQVLWRDGERVDRGAVPAGAQQVHALANGATLASTIVLHEDAPRPFIVRFGAAPTATMRRGEVDLEAARAPYRRLLADLPALEAGLRAARGAAAARFEVRRRLEVSFNGVAITASAVLAERLRALPYVTGVFPDDSVHALRDPAAATAGAEIARAALGPSGAGVLVSVIDTGVDWRHPALGGCLGPGCRVIGGHDFVNGDADPMDDHGHGTHVAGIVGGDAPGLAGVAPGVRFLAYKVLGASGGGMLSDVIAAIDRSLDPDGDPRTADGAGVINLSLGGGGHADDPVSQAVDAAVASGVVCVVAAGNAGAWFTVQSPGCARRAITVGAVDAFDRIAGFSSRGPAAPDDAIKPDVLAPGVGILSAWPGGGSAALSGTSMAAPHVAGVVALLRERDPGATPEAIKAALMNTARDLGEGPFAQGAGRVDPVAAAAPEITLDPPSLGFGLAPSAAPVWTSAATLTVRNASARARTVTLSAASDLPTGSSFQVSPASLALAAGESRTITATLALDRAAGVMAPPHAYTGALHAESDGRTWRVPFAVLRSPQLVIRVEDGGMAVVHDRGGYQAALALNGPGVRRLFVPAGTYDVVASLGAAARVVREGIVVADSAAVELRAADAVHAIERACVDERGNPIAPPIGIEYLRHRESRFGILTVGTMSPVTRFSTIGDAYDWEWHRLSYGQETRTYAFRGAQRGVAASAVLRNAPGDLRRVTMTYHPSPGIHELLPVRWISDGPLGTPGPNGPAIASIGTTGWVPPLVAPFTQETWFMEADDPSLHFGARFHAAYPYAGVPYPVGAPDVVTPYVIDSPGQPLRGYLAGDDAHPVTEIAGDRWDVGQAPPAWIGGFRNAPDRLQVAPRFGAAAWLFLAQQGDARDHAAMPFSLAREGTVVEMGATNGALARPLTPGRHALMLTHDRFWLGDQRCRATVTAAFDSRAADPDPPWIGPVRIGDGGAIAFTVEESVPRDSVTLAVRPLGTTAWTARPLAGAGHHFEATPPPGPAGPLGLRIEASDPAGNRLTWIAEPAVTRDAAPDAVPPSVAVTSPNGGESWSAGSERTITWTAADEVGVSAVDLAWSSDGGASFPHPIAAGVPNTGAFAWTPSTPGVAMRVRVTARDAAGNSGHDASDADFAVAPDSNRVGNGDFESGTTGWAAYGSATLTLATEGRTGSRALQIRGSSSSSFGGDDQPNWIGIVAAKGAVYRITAWVKTATRSRGSVRMRVYEYLGSSQQGSTAYSNTVALSAAWSLLTMDYVVRTAGSTLSLRIVDSPAASGETFLVDDVVIKVVAMPPDHPPVVTAPAAAGGSPGVPITFTVSAADPDGAPIADLAVSGKPDAATFTVNAARTQGTFTWTPQAADVRAEPYPIAFTATNTKSATAGTALLVSAAPPNLCGNGDFETNASGWGPYGSAALAVVAGGRSGNALRVAGSSSFGIDDVPDWLPAPLTRGAVYRISAWVKRSSGSGSAGSVKIRVYEYLGSTQQGSTAYSPTVTLSTSWQPLTVLYTVRTAGTRLSLRITDAASSSESFLVDEVRIERVVAGTTATSDVPSSLEVTAARFEAAFVPNPARTEGVLTFGTTRPGSARVDLLDVNGRLVARLLDARTLEPGVHAIRVDRARTRGGRLEAGVYFYWIRAGEGTIRGRIVFLK